MLPLIRKEDTDGHDPDLDFIAGTIVTRRDPVHQLIETISGLYIGSEDKEVEEKSHESLPLLKDPFAPLPPPPEEDEASSQECWPAE